jgi:hypothetical protein
MRRAVPLLLALICLLAVPAGASARFTVGLGDQNPATYDLGRVDALHLKTARYVVNWDWYRDPARVAITDQWMASVRAAGLRPLIAFNRNWLPSGLHRLPTIPQYLQSFALLRYRYPDVRDFGAWNEANHKTQPLAHNPRMAARYYNAMHSACPRCNVVAADVLDDPAMPAWIRTFKRYAHHPRLWGLHNYRDANRLQTVNTRRLLRATHAYIWLTETGGIVNRANKSTVTFEESPEHAAEATRWVFDRIVPLSSRITRVYLYQWNALTTHDTWDSALIGPDNHARPALAVLKRVLRSGPRIAKTKPRKPRKR